MGVTKKMKFGFYFQYLISQRQISPMYSVGFVQYHRRWFVCNKYVYTMWYDALLMIVCQTKESHTLDFTASVLLEINIIGQVFYVFSFP